MNFMNRAWLYIVRKIGKYSSFCHFAGDGNLCTDRSIAGKRF